MEPGVDAVGNDVASAWLALLIQDFDDPSLVAMTLELVADGDGRQDLEACQRAVAAAEVVAAAGLKPRPDMDQEVLAWVEPHWPALWNGNRRAALGVVKIVLESSALLAHWQQSPDYQAWKLDMEDLRDRLS